MYTVSGVVLVVYGLTEILRNGLFPEGQGVSPYLSGLCVGLFLLACAWIVPILQSRKMKANTPNLQGVLRYEFDDEGVRIIGPHGESAHRWPAIIRCRENRNVFLLYQTPRIANIIPKRFFANEQDVVAARELLRTHISKGK
jgi:hypothetical protein